jgi:hypothetical protein
MISKRYSPPVMAAGALLVKIVQVEKSGEYGACFCSPGTELVEHYACRGTMLMGSRL